MPETKPSLKINVPDVLAQELKDDGIFPNSKLKLLVYRKAVELPEDNPASIFEQLFGANKWQGSWRNGIYPYHHYHSTAHEVLGIYSGWANVQLGGEKGIALEIQAGDVIIIPAGMAHKKLRSSSDFGVVGAYPEGQDWDMNYGKPGERPNADRNIERVALPKLDPIYGAGGPVLETWVAR